MSMEYMADVMERLEAWRVANDLSKVEMTGLMGANSKQQYHGWVGRNSLPKAFFHVAARILGENPASATSKPGGPYEDSVFKLLSREDKKTVTLALLADLDNEGRTAALRFLLKLK